MSIGVMESETSLEVASEKENEKPLFRLFCESVAHFEALRSDFFLWLEEHFVPWREGLFDYFDDEMIGLFARDQRITKLKGCLEFGFASDNTRVIRYTRYELTLSIKVPSRYR